MIGVDIHLTFVAPPSALEAALPEAVDEGLTAAGLKWHSDYLPLHFKDFAPARYGLQSRTYKYNQWKRAKVGHTRPMVLSGTLERAMKSQVRIKARAGIVDVRMSGRGLGSLNLWRGGVRKHNFPRDITATTGEELQKLAQQLNDSIQTRLERVQTQESAG